MFTSFTLSKKYCSQKANSLQKFKTALLLFIFSGKGNRMPGGVQLLSLVGMKLWRTLKFLFS